MPSPPINVFVSDLDTPAQHQISRRLAAARVGSRRPKSDQPDGDGNGNGDSGGGDHDDSHNNNNGGGNNNDDHSGGDDSGGGGVGKLARGGMGLQGALRAGSGGGGGSGDEAQQQEQQLDRYVIRGTLRYKPVAPPKHAHESAGDAVPEEMQIDMHDPVGKTAATRDLTAGIHAPGKPGGHVTGVFSRTDRDALKAAVLAAKVIILDLIQSTDDVPFIIQSTPLNDHAATFVDNPKTIIAMSTVMTWGRTKPDQEDPEAPLAEDEYRRRKPHANFRTHVALEKEWVKLGKKECYRAYVVFSGLQYHVGDSVFHHMLKSAWHGAEVPIFGDGNNFLPMIHLEDVCDLVVHLVENAPEDVKYVLAVDDSRSSYGDIARAISTTLGNGKVKVLPKEQAILDADLDQVARDLLGANLRFEASTIKRFSLKWKYESGLLDNLSRFMDEYRRGRGLTPVKVLLLGPPHVGKSHYGAKLAARYKLPLVDTETVMRETMERLARRVQIGTAMANGEQNSGEDGNGATEMAALAAIAAQEQIDPADLDGEKELLDELAEYSKGHGGAFPDVHISSFLRAKLASMPCQNQGYVLDGYPLTRGAAIALFRKDDGDGGGGASGASTGLGGEGGEGEEAGALPPLDPNLVPTHVVVLDAPDDWIKDRAMQRPDVEATGRDSEEGLIARLIEYRAQNTDDITVLNFFDEAEIHPAFYNVMTGGSGPVSGVLAAPGTVAAPAAPQASSSSASGSVSFAPAASSAAANSGGGMVTNNNSPPGTSKPFEITDMLLKLVGKPHNYGPSKEDVALRRRLKAEEATRIARRMEQEEHERQQAERERHAKSVAEWNAKLEEVRRQEQEVLEAQSLPLRHYLIQNVIPTLSAGLIEVCKVRPEDPIDYLAEFLFRHAPLSLSGVDAPAFTKKAGAEGGKAAATSSELGGVALGSVHGSPTRPSRPTSAKNLAPLPPIPGGPLQQQQHHDGGGSAI
ncbi:hypothetical protein BC828DRAFT_405476 [Blastocladiella britannica]|nr:hypothetical protein BC828DRAFT_405476 [Blastocladiella britannica]